MQIGEFALELDMMVIGSRNIARAARAGPRSLDGGVHGRQHCRMLTHAKIVVRAPDRDLIGEAMVEGAWKPARATLQLSENTASSLGSENIETLLGDPVVALICLPPCASSC